MVIQLVTCFVIGVEVSLSWNSCGCLSSSCDVGQPVAASSVYDSRQRYTEMCNHSSQQKSLLSGIGRLPGGTSLDHYPCDVVLMECGRSLDSP